MALRAIKSPSRFARHTGQSPTRNVYHISVRMLPGSSGGRPMLCRALAPTSSPGWAGASCAPLPRPSVVSWPLVAQVASGSRPLRLRLACCVRSRARPPPLLRSPGPALAPSLRSPGPGLPCLPPALSLGPCARFRAPWALAGPVCLRPRPRLCCGLPVRSPLRRSGLGLVQRVAPRGAASAPLRGFGPGGSPPCPRCAAFGRAFPSRGPGFWLRARACPRLLRVCRGCFRGRWVLPASPPAPAAPLGLSGGAWPPA